MDGSLYSFGEKICFFNIYCKNCERKQNVVSVKKKRIRKMGVEC